MSASFQDQLHLVVDSPTIGLYRHYDFQHYMFLHSDPIKILFLHVMEAMIV